jgi:hypothetical protein
MFLLAGTIALSAFQVARQTPPSDPADNGIVEGDVRRVGTSEPIADVPVTLAGPRETIGDAMSHAVRTDAKGHFIFKDVAPNTYSVTTGGDGYFKPLDGTGRNSTYSTKPITLAAKQHIADIVMELVSSSTIRGRVRDADGDPVIGAEVQALTPTYRDGMRSLTSSKTATTDDRGEYRIFWLNPGDYFIRTYVRTSDFAALPAFRQDTQAAPEFTYYPGTLDESGAQLVPARSGMEEVADFRMVAPAARKLFSISGKVLTSIPGTADMRISLLYLVPRGTVGPARSSVSLVNSASFRTPGEFNLSGVPPGQYDMYPVVTDNQGHSHTARTPVEVVDRSIENIVVSIRPGVELRGRIVVDGAVPAGKLGNATVSLNSIDGVPTIFQYSPDSSSSAIVANRETGEFSVLGVVNGKYDIVSNIANSGNYYFVDILQGGRSVFDNGFMVTTETPEPLEIRVSAKGGVAEGIIRDSQRRPIANATVVIVPPLSRRQNSLLYKRGASDGDGHFSIKGLAPGEYKIFAWSNVPTGAWENSDFMQRYEQQGQRLVITATQTSNVQVTVIP